MSGMLSAAWAYRNFVVTSVRNEFVSMFVRSRLGGLWMIIQPLVMVTIYAVILSAVLRAKLPGLEDNRYGYAVYLISGIVCWALFNDVLNRCLNLFIQSANLMKKIVFPKICLPLTVVGVALINNLMLIAAAILIFVLVGHDLKLPVLYVPVLIALTMGLGLGFGLILGILNVFMRDIGQAVPLLLQVGFWFTPIVYPVTIVPDAVRPLLFLNPVYPLVEAYHSVLAYGESPEWWSLLAVALGVAVLLALALWMFRQASAEMVDVL